MHPQLILSLVFLLACGQSPSDSSGTVVETAPAINIQQETCPESINLTYSWTDEHQADQSLYCRIGVPEGFERVQVETGSFAEWLRYLPLQPAGSEVHLFNGALKGRQDVHAAIVDLDVGKRDLQQCADAVMRMRGEYLYAQKNYPAIHFNYTSGDKIGFEKWKDGWRPVVSGNTVNWRKKAAPDASHASFRKYMDNIYTYAGTASLSKEMRSISISELSPGDVFILGGHPGHAVLVLDVAVHPQTQQKRFLLAQSYMPAQEFHVLKNPSDDELSPWYEADFGETLYTPEWNFKARDLKRF